MTKVRENNKNFLHVTLKRHGDETLIDSDCAATAIYLTRQENAINSLGAMM